MKKPTTFKSVLVVLFFIQSFIVFSQKDFTARYDTSLKGDMLLIGNNILNRDNNRNGERPNNAFNSTSQNNNDLNMQYIDIDSDATTFSSSSANLVIPTGSRECYKVVYAGLYWAGIYSKGAVDNGTVNRANLGSIKFKLPGQTNYTDITGSLIYDYFPATSNGDQMPYAYYYDATTLVQALANPEGTYTAANIISARGTINGGFSAGWNLFVVYEDPKSSAKYITSFDGFRWIQSSSGPVTYPISGFKTIPTGVVKAKLAFAALEGDVNLTGDRYSINNTDISTTERPINNFFNSTINDTSGPYTNRNPNSGNTLGFEAGIINLNNASNSIINNNDTSAVLKLSTNGDGYGLFFNAFNVEIIEPKIVLTKIVKNSAGVDIGGQDVTLGQQLNYEIGFRNTGNDNATSFTIRDQLPINIIFNYPGDIVSLPTGVTIQSYDATTRNIVFAIDNNVVKVGDPEKIISFKVQVVPDCHMLSEACSNSIDNSAYATYRGTQNTTFIISDDPSVNVNTGCILIPKATNFLVGIDGCKFEENVTLCGESINLVAANGYTNYTWYSDEARTNQIGTGQTFNVRNPGTYYVYNLAAAPCRSIYQSFVVTRFGNTTENPVIPFADQVVTCSNDGKRLPNIFLCGANASRQITTNISDASSIVWERLDEASCTAVTNQNCANESNSCTWIPVGSGGNYNASIAGQYRLTLNYAGGCFNRFYFNVYTNSLNATEIHEDIICGTNGSITIEGVPAGYEYALSTDPNGTVGTYQTSNTFTISNPNSYTVHIRQIGVTTNPCNFTVPNILIRRRNLEISTFVTQPSCFGEKGAIKVGALNIDPQYYYYIYDGSTLVNSVGPINESDYTFDNLTPGISYRVRVTNRPVNGSPAPNCDVSEYIYIQQPVSAIVATAALVEPLTACSNGKIVVSATGGNYAPYYYFINGSSTFQTSNEIEVTEPGVYEIRVVDSQNCSTTTSITIPNATKPTYTISNTNSNCYNDNSQISVNVTNANGYSMSYSINNGGSFQTNPVFSNLQPGTYNVVVRYGISYIPQWQTQPQIKYCTDPAQQVIISGPASAVTASGGVAALAGCTLPDGSGVNQGGKLRINNAQGGTAPYQYSFDNGTTWQSSNEKDVLPGQYILKIRDALGCEFTIPYDIILDQKPAEPTITVEDPVFNCNGTATSTVTVTNGTSANYSYEYYLDGVPNAPITNNVFLDVPSGTHTISVKYNVTTVSTYSNLLQEDFGIGGYTTTPGISPLYCFEDETTPHPTNWPALCGDINDYQINDGKYAVASSINTNFGGSWIFAKDHTLPANPLGRFLCVNVGASAGVGGILYSKPINDVIPNQPVIISLWAENLIVGSSTSHADPELTIQLINNLNGVGGPETIVATTDTTNPWRIPKSEQWEYNELSLNPGTYNNLSFVIRSYSIQFNGNDVLLDDIWVRQIPESCIAQKDFPILIDSNRAFTASITGFKDLTCSGSNDGEITISAQNFNLPYGFDYSLNDGTTWINSKVSPVTATGLGSGNYNIRVRFDASASSCVLPLTHEINAPAALTVTAQVTTQPTCTTGASITATALGGTPSYQYELRESNGVTVVVPFQSSRVFTNVASGSYTVVTRDANSCASPASVQVDINAPTPPTASLDTTSDLCYDTTNQSTLVVTATGTGVLTYSLNGLPAQTSNTFTNVGPGTHNIIVTDSNNCTATISDIVIAPQLGAIATISKTLDCTSVSPDATITVNITGGTSAFTYRVRRGAGAYGSSNAVTGTSFVYSASTADIYTFQITDATGCIVTVNATVNAIINPTITATKIDATCNGAATGSVQLVGAGGSGGFTYLFYNSSVTPAPTTFIAQSNYTGLAEGTYSYQVMDSKGCTSVLGSITINQPTTLTATASATTFTCNASNVKQTATVTIAVPTTGTAPYQYSFDGGTTFTNTRTLPVTDNGTNQTISYVVSDAQGCKTPVQTITINRLNPPTDITFNAAAVTCTATTTTVTAVATNGVGIITYSITSPVASVVSNTTGVFTGLAPGTYNFRATDANGCYFDKPFTIAAVTPISIVGNKDNDVLCRGGSTGNITFTVSGNATVGAYTATLTAGTGTLVKTGNTVTLSNVPAGTYTVQVTDDATGCTNTATIIVNQPANALTFTATRTNISCNNGLAQITITANGGTPNYTYAVVRAGTAAPTVYASGNVLSVDTNSGANLNWDVYVKDANGCITTNPVAISSDALPTVTASNSNQCTGSGNSFILTATGTGIAPLTYSIDGTSFQASNIFNVPAGTYTVTVRDGNGCTATTTTPLVIYPQLAVVSSVTKELDCTPTPNATITVVISGGRAPFRYTVTKGTGTPSALSAPISGPTFTYNVIQADVDSYIFAVTDANGCSTSSTTTVVGIANPSVTETHVNPSCNGGNNGSVELVGAGGSGGYTYSSNGTTYTPNATFSGLAAGTYTFYVKDSKDCTGTVIVNLTAPNQLEATVTEVPFTCDIANSKVAGSVTINATTGTGTAPYQYSFNGGDFGNANTFTLNDNGADQNYTYSVRDAQGCIISGSGTLFRLNPPTDLTFAANAITCTATTTTVTLTAVNGVGILQYETIAPSPVIIAKQTSNSFANLAPGTYMFKVTDANGCFYTEAHTINQVTPITLIGTKISDVLCNAGNTGSARYTVAGYAGTYSYTVNGGSAVTGQTASTINLTNRIAGDYTVIVTDEVTGCTETALVTINEPAALSATYATINGNCAVTTSSVTVTVTGGSPVYRYSFVENNAAIGAYTNSNTANLDAAVNTEWDVHIIDANGCTLKLDITIARDVVPSVTASATGQCFGVGTYTITATPGAGLVAPITYSIDNGASFQTGNTFVISAPGNYTVRVRDGNGCTANSNVVIVDNILGLTAVLDKDITCTAPMDAQVTLTPNGGSVPYTYESKEALGAYTALASNVFNTLNPGSYTFRVTDANGCVFETTTPIIITATVQPEITSVTQTQSINCSGDDTAAIAIVYDATKGQSPFLITVLNTTTGVDYGTQTSGLAAGNYTVTVTDARGCFDTQNIVISEPLPITVIHHSVPITCNILTGISKGSVIVDSVTGGVGPYNYFVTGVNGYDESELNNLGTTSVSFNVVDFGLYQINVVDSNGCSVLIQNVLVASPPEDLDITVTPPPADCSALGSAVVAIGAASTAITGDGPFHFAVYTGPGMTYTGPTALPWYDEDGFESKKTTIPNLIPGVLYTFIVHDAYTGCYYFETAELPIPTNSTLTTSALTSNNITCRGNADGNVTFTINSTYTSDTPISYEIFNSLSMVSTGITGTGTVPTGGSLTLSNIGSLPFGNYIIVVSETAGATNAGCSVATVPFNITESAIDLSVTASVSKNANCNPNSGVITAVAKDGTAPYSYLLLPASDPAPNATTAGWASANTFNRNAGDYVAYVKDDYGCIKPFPITLDRDADPTINPVAEICYNGNPFTITITGTVDPAINGGATYSVNGSAFQTSPNFTFNDSGTYNLVIQDGNGCTATTSYEVKPQLFLSALLTRELDCTATPNAEITLTATGGYNTSYTYEYSTDGGVSYTTMASNVLSTSVLGNYIFRVSDAKLPVACQATTTFTLDAIPPTVFTTTQTHVSCFGGNDGTITVNVSSGVGSYEYQLDAGAFQSSNIFTDLTAGTSYVVTVRDAKSCVYSNAPITITQPNDLTASSVVTISLTCASGNVPTKAVVTVTASGGTSPYQYSFDGVNYSDVNTYESFVGTTFDVLVRDAKGCFFPLVDGVNIPALNPPTITNIAATPIWCNPVANTTSTATITTTNGVGPLSYAILAPASATSNVSGASNGVFTGLADGPYLFEVTDANGCKDQESITINPVTNITIDAQLVRNVTCNGAADGAIRFTAANYATSYTANLIAGTGTLVQTGNTVNVTGLVPGTYTVEIRDNTTGCTATASIEVTQPSPVVLTLVSNVNANCNFGARVSVSAAGGTPGYRYAFVQSGVTPVMGDYDTVASAVLDPTVNTAWDVYVLDANNCPDILNVTIGTDALPTIDSSVGLYCYTGGPVPITITGTYVGTPMFSIGNGYQSSPDFVLNAPGNYTFYIQDGNGCITPSPYTLNQELLLQATLTQDYTCAGDASISLLATQGTITYTDFDVSFNGGAYTAVTLPLPYTTNIPGIYTFRVTDSQGCQAASVSVEVTDRTTPTATAIENNVSCPGGSDGSIVITAADGVLPYRYSIDNGVSFQDSNIFTGLAAGSYDIVVQDAKQCISIILPVTITEPNALVATAFLTQGLTCGTGNAAQAATVTVTVDPTTGTAPYQYSFNGGVRYGNENEYTTTTSGTVTAYVKDANNCVIAVPVDVIIPALDPPTIDTVTGTPIWCNPGANTTSTVTVSVSHGVGTLNFEITSPASAVSNVSGASSGVFSLLPAGTYIFKVTDANGCIDEDTYTVDPLVNITIAGQLVNDVVCNGVANGSVKFDVDNFDGTYTATLIGGPMTGTLTQTGKVVTLTNLPIGTYTVQVIDNVTNCVETASVTVGQPDALSLTQTGNINANCNSGAQVAVTAAGGTPNYQYAFVLGTGTPAPGDYSNSNIAVLDPALGTNWRAYVLDANNCETFIPITIIVDQLPNAITTNIVSQCPSATGDYTFTVTVGGGVAPFEYSIGSGFQSSNTFTVNAPGTYDVIVRDANQCEVTATAAVTIVPVLQLETSITALPGCTVTNNGVITATATGGSGTANYRYTLDGGVIVTTTPAVFNNVTPGNHIVRVRDVDTTCDFEVVVYVAPATTITGFTLAKTDVTCNGGNNGTITASLTASSTGVNDNPIYTYRLTGTTVLGVAVSRPNQTNPVFENLEAGDYTVIVTSGRGCEDFEDVTISQPALITVGAPIIVQYGCTAGTNASNYATVTVGTVAGGSGAYTIYEFVRNGVVVQRGSETVYIESDFLGGNYSVNVFDDNGCTGSSAGTVTVNPFISLDAVNVVVNAGITCVSNEDITVTVTSTGGTPVLLNYTVTGTNGNPFNQSNTNGNFTGLTIGDYLITVVNPATGCTIQKIHYVNEPNTFEIKATPINRNICYGTNTGSVELTFVDNQLVPADEAGPFTYTITGPVPSTGTTTTAGPIVISNLTAGQYTVVAKLINSPECEVSTVFNIVQPSTQLAVTTTQSEITCNPGNNDGEIAASATGGWDNNYEYELVLNGATVVNYSTQSNFTGLSAGVYTINVRDGNGCPVSTTAALVVPTPIVITANANTPVLSCFGDKSGVITVNPPTGGQGSNYMYTLNILSADPVIVSGPQPDPIFTGLGAGTYSITVSDGFNCTATTTDIVITEPTEVIPSLVLAASQTCNTQSTLTLSAVGGSAPYAYSTDATFATITGSFTSSVTFAVPVGTYQYYVRDANGCVATISNEVKIDALLPLTVDLDVTNAVVKCTGEATGVIVAEAKGGLGNYLYTLEDTTGTIVQGPQDNGRFENLIIGNYRVRVDSGDCNSTSVDVEITQPATALQAIFTATNVSCFGENNGKIVVTAIGGTGTIKYAISPDLNQFDFISTFDRLAPGTYKIIVQDQNGCYIIEDVEITQPNLLFATLTPDSIIPEECKGDNDGSFVVDIQGGTAPYTATIDNIDGTYVPVIGTQHTFENLAGGTHTVFIKDALNCIYEFEVVMPDSVVLDPTFEINYDCVNNASANMVTVTIDASITNPADVDYSLDGSGTYQTSNIFMNVAPGTHFIVARHSNGCEVPTANFSIVAVAPLTLALSGGQPEMNVISVTAGGGSPAYEYSFNGEPFTTSNKYKIYQSGDYEVIVRDQNGCTATLIVPMTYIDVCIPNYFTPNGDGLYDEWGPGCTNIYNNLEFSIFDRYGRVIAKYRYGQKWDGRYNGEELPTGDYWYVLKLNDAKDAREFVGHFTLYR
ncbi:T9SS type B sorting domain-containing protein [Flavobacterium piscis]|uniref:Gliding motility-associated-like protein n=1 Tax=Flavobacterium piscis TaxID=1114874 RepID=A0ABU1YAY9_9FLAO|nr:T9SS type B sorting domain-containing protein [Flavobacterium piscis]MDR7211318.1 gliding motility-associated-like protein [Flavobacterium piscis]